MKCFSPEDEAEEGHVPRLQDLLAAFLFTQGLDVQGLGHGGRVGFDIRCMPQRIYGASALWISCYI